MGYGLLLTVCLAGLQLRYARATAIPALLLAGTALGVAYSAYLTYLQAAVIQAWCQWCVISAIAITLCFLAALPELGRLGRHP